MTSKVYLVVGVPGAGKSWISKQLKDKFNYVHHDGYIHLKDPKAYHRAIIDAARDNTEPVLAEAPFSVTQIKDPLTQAGLNVETVFIIEDDKTLSDRYKQRESRQIPKGHLTRTKTYLARAKETNSFYGTSEEVLAYLKAV